MVGRDDLRGLLQPMILWFCDYTDSIILHEQNGEERKTKR